MTANVLRCLYRWILFIRVIQFFGCFSNAIEHLRIGTQSENMKECHDVGALSKRRKISNE